MEVSFPEKLSLSRQKQKRSKYQLPTWDSKTKRGGPAVRPKNVICRVYGQEI